MNNLALAFFLYVLFNSMVYFYYAGKGKLDYTAMKGPTLLFFGFIYLAIAILILGSV